MKDECSGSKSGKVVERWPERTLEVKCKLLHPDAKLPKYSRDGDAGMDLFAVSRTFDDHGNIVYDTGVSIALDQGYVADLRPRSGVTKYDLNMLNSPGTVDSNYRGPLIIKFRPTKEDPKIYEVGERIAQLVIIPIPYIILEEVDDLDETVRGTGGFGSSGTK